jgi:hypothetical protein
LLNSTREQILSVVFVSGFGLILSGKLLYLAFLAQNTEPISNLIITQRKRYGSLIAAVVIALVSLYPVYRYGYHDTTAALDYARDRVSIFGWLLTIIFFGQFAVLILSMPIAVDAYAHPAYLAKAAGKWYHLRQKQYICTLDVRKGNRPYPLVEPHSIVEDGRPIRRYHER